MNSVGHYFWDNSGCFVLQCCMVPAALVSSEPYLGKYQLYFVSAKLNLSIKAGLKITSLC